MNCHPGDRTAISFVGGNIDHHSTAKGIDKGNTKQASPLFIPRGDYNTLSHRIAARLVPSLIAVRVNGNRTAAKGKTVP